MKNLIAWFKDEEGQGMVEYALIIGLISIVAIAVLIVVGNKIKTKFQAVNDNL
jgi:pilus assembly protein Flp/PilA